jgi:hypothetical protein
MGNNTSKKKSLWVKCKKPPVLGGGGGGWYLSSSWEIVTTKVKGWMTKIQFQRGRLTREQLHHPPFHWIVHWV